MNNPRLKSDFYRQTDTVAVARALLGKKLVTRFGGVTTAGMICETEAYCGIEDRGCHAYSGRYTDRTRIIYAAGGVTYVYLCYGIHHLFNVVTHQEGEPHAVLIRAIEPLEGIDTMLERRKQKTLTPGLGAGPGLAAQCLGFTTKHTGLSLMEDTVWIEVHTSIEPSQIISSARVGMHFSGAYKTIPWRFRIADSLFTSKAR